MPLIKSISGIRGTIGGKPGEGLTPTDVIKFTAGYGTWLGKRHNNTGLKVVIGRDARRSGTLVASLVINVLRSLGIDVVDLGLATTPTVEIAVTGLGASGGIIVTASHNPENWNAMKLLNEDGEFLSSRDGLEVLEIAESDNITFVQLDQTGSLTEDNSWAEKHIGKVLELGLVDTNAIRKANFSVAIDCINSVGGIVLPKLLTALGVSRIIGLNTHPDGRFTHNPEPLPEHLTDISALVVKEKADVGFVVDPDVDRLAIISEDGSMFGEEYTLVAVSDYVLTNTPGNTVSNLSSSRALKDITEKHGKSYFSAAVGEVNVVEEMKKCNAVIGGEGNGGVIYPDLHYGRDALAGVALFLSHLAKSGLKCSSLRHLYPRYVIVKKRMVLSDDMDFGMIKEDLKSEFNEQSIDERDGLRIEYENGWVQIRKSNTEPIIRIYAEGQTSEEAGLLANRVIKFVKKA